MVDATGMYALLRVFIEICLLRAGPQALPHSTLLLGLCLTLYGFSGLLLVSERQLATALGQIVVDAGVLLGLLYLLLRQRGMSHRFVQAATAAVGSGALLGWLAVPIVLTMPPLRAAAAAPPLAALALVGLMAWSVIVLGHILREAVSSSSLATGIGLALVYVLVSLLTIGFLFPAASG